MQPKYKTIVKDARFVGTTTGDGAAGHIIYDIWKDNAFVSLVDYLGGVIKFRHERVRHYASTGVMWACQAQTLLDRADDPSISPHAT